MRAEVDALLDDALIEEREREEREQERLHELAAEWDDDE